MLIVFEGIDGSGKTTLSCAVKMELERLNVKSIITSEFGRKDAWSVAGKAELLAARNQREQYRAVMRARLQHSKQVLDVAPANSVVLMDRYLPSTIAYQSTPTQSMGQMYRDHLNNALPVPVIVFYIQINPETAQLRTKNRGRQDAFDAKGVEYFTELHNRYLVALEGLQRANGWKYQVISGEQHLSDLVKSCVATIMQCVNEASKEVA